MPKQAENILADALELPPMARAELVENILSSFEFQGKNTINALWAQEAEDRIDAFERGELNAIPAKDIFAEIEKSK
jgi:putative addiction module component (TIGR02574 family)